MADAHTVTYDRTDVPLCWAETPRWGDRCTRPEASDLGLCEAHYEAKREETRC